MDKGSKRYTLKQSLKRSLGNGVELQEAVKLPESEDLNEWIAMNTMEMYNTATLCWGFISDFCTEKCCPQMTAGKKFTYLWQDGKKYPKATSVSASQYVELLFAWVSERIDDNSVFPEDGSFGKNFVPSCCQIWKRLARVYFHIYHHHWEQIETLKAESHINTCFKHLYFFASEFSLMTAEDFSPVEDLVKKLQERLIAENQQLQQ